MNGLCRSLKNNCKNRHRKWLKTAHYTKIKKKIWISTFSKILSLNCRFSIRGSIEIFLVLWKHEVHLSASGTAKLLFVKSLIVSLSFRQIFSSVFRNVVSRTDSSPGTGRGVLYMSLTGRGSHVRFFRATRRTSCEVYTSTCQK